MTNLLSHSVSITIDGVNKTLHNKTKFKEYISTISPIQNVILGKLQPKEINYEKTLNTLKYVTLSALPFPRFPPALLKPVTLYF